jgi:hypothetical protein
MSFPMKYRPDIIEKIVEQLQIGMSREDTIVLVGINRDTFYDWLKNKPDFSDKVLKAEMVCKQRSIVRIQQHGRRDWRAAAWWLSRKYKGEYEEQTTHKIAGHDGGPLKPANGPDLKDIDEKTLKQFIVAVDKAVEKLPTKE